MPDPSNRSPFGLSAVLGAVLVLSGLGFLGYSLGVYFELLPGSRVTVPNPVALEQPRPTATVAPAAPTAAAGATPTLRPAPTRPPTGTTITANPTPRPITGAMLAPPDPSVFATPQAAADAEDRAYWSDRPRPGIAVHLEIPRVDIKTEVTEGGIITNKQGNLEWETVPFIAVQYRETARVGGRGNAVISGHVVTINEGNVFRNLYKVEFGDEVSVRTEAGRFTYVVEDVKLVKPTSVEVMAPSTSSLLTLITCGGEFDPRSRTFSDRLIVTGRLVDWARADEPAALVADPPA